MILPVTLTSKISKQIINLSWGQVHSMVKILSLNCWKDLNFQAHQGGGEILLPHEHKHPSSLNQPLVSTPPHRP